MTAVSSFNEAAAHAANERAGPRAPYFSAH